MTGAVAAAFLPAAAFGILGPLAPARNRRNLAFPFVLVGLFLPILARPRADGRAG